MPEEMSDEEKRLATMRLAGQCNFLCLFIFTMAALGCGLAATGYCAFVNRDVVLKPEYRDVRAVCSNFTASEDISTEQCESLLGNQHGIGFFGFQVTIPVNFKICLSYTQPTPVGYVTLPTDTKFNAARAFTYVADFFGMMAFFTLGFASCCPLNAQRMSGLSLYYFIATLFQGLTLLILRSSACQKGFFAPFFQAISNNNLVGDFDPVESASCSLSAGSKMAIAATVLYFWCMMTVPAAHPPPPLGGSGSGRGGAPTEEGPVADEQA